MPASSDSCGQIALCAWRTATLLTSAGRPTDPTDLCIAIGGSGEPCGRKATGRIGKRVDADTLEVTFPGQPFCTGHYKQILDSAFQTIADRHYEPSELLAKNRELHLQLDELRTAARTKTKRQFRREWVYFAQSGDIVKIGYSQDVEQRLRGFAASNPDIHLIALEAGTRALERRLHRQFAGDKVQSSIGRELFHLTPTVRDYILNGRTCPLCSDHCLPDRAVCATHEAARFDPEDLLSGWTLTPQTQLTPT